VVLYYVLTRSFSKKNTCPSVRILSSRARAQPARSTRSSSTSWAHRWRRWTSKACVALLCW